MAPRHRTRPGRTARPSLAAHGCRRFRPPGAGQRSSRLAVRAPRRRRLAPRCLGTRPGLGGPGLSGLGRTGEQRSRRRAGTPPRGRRGRRRASFSWRWPGSVSGAAASAAEPAPQWRRLWWVAAAWVAPLLLAAPFASQDVWVYVAQGKLVASGFGSDQPGAPPRAPLGLALGRRSEISDRALHLRARRGRPLRPARAGRRVDTPGSPSKSGGWPSSASLVLCALGRRSGRRRSWHQPGRSRGRRRGESRRAPRLRRRHPQRRRDDQSRRGGRRPGAHRTPVVGLVPGRPGGSRSRRRRHSPCSPSPGGAGRARGVAVPTYLAGGIALSLGALVRLRARLAAATASAGCAPPRKATVASSFSLLNLAGSARHRVSPTSCSWAASPLAVAIVLLLPRRASWVGALWRLAFGVMAVCATNPQPWYVLVGAPAAGLHGVRRPTPSRRHLRAVRHGDLERPALRQPRLVRRHRRPHVDPGPLGAPAPGRLEAPATADRWRPTGPRSTSLIPAARDRRRRHRPSAARCSL